MAHERSLDPLIITFDVHPRAVLQADYIPQLLTTLNDRKALLSQYGEVVVLPFSEIRQLTAQDFMRTLKTQYNVEVLLMGYDHMFGSDRLRRHQDYRRIGESVGIDVISLGEYIDGELHVSSTEIRQALLSGNIAVANELLGRPYSLTGVVTHGNGIGRTIGFPTANIAPTDSSLIIPKPGVYAVEITNHQLQSPTIFALCNIGTNPTVGNTEQTIEVYIPDFSGNLYDTELTIRFARFIREEKTFPSLDALREQIQEDLNVLTLRNNL